MQKSDAGSALGKRLHIGSVGVSGVAVGAMLVAFLLVVVNFVALLRLDPGHRYLYSHALADGPDRLAGRELLVHDGPALSAVMALIITGVGSLIHVYACSYTWRRSRPTGGSSPT